MFLWLGGVEVMVIGEDRGQGGGGGNGFVCGYCLLVEIVIEVEVVVEVDMNCKS